MRNTIVGIDPGKSGGVAWRIHDGCVSSVKMPETLHDTAELLRSIDFTSCEDTIVYLEKVGFHVKGNNASASVKFARHCGELRGILAALQMPFREVTPVVWQRAMGALPKDKGDRKRAIKARMQCLYPMQGVTLATADALAILDYAVKNEALAIGAGTGGA